MDASEIRDFLQRRLNPYDSAVEFFGRLGYADAADAPVSTREWTESLKRYGLRPIYMAQLGDFKIIYCELPGDRILRTVQRPVIDQLARYHDFFMVVFHNRAQNAWDFVNVRVTEDEQTGRIHRLARRITIGESERQLNRLFTASRRLEQIDVNQRQNISLLELQALHNEAFDVETVTRDFYQQYVRVFDQLSDDIARLNPSLAQDADRQAQTLLDRLMFLYFIQRKGWLNAEFDYLFRRFIDPVKQHENRADETSYYEEVIKPLFLKLAIRDYQTATGEHIPFLNGGLFQFDTQHMVMHLHVSNAAFKFAFDNLFERYAFTVEEDMPDDRTVAIDPEMLGKVFESLILNREQDKDLRKSTGSYYTPRTIVSFMCQQSLREYIVQAWRNSYQAASPDGQFPLKMEAKGGQGELRDLQLEGGEKAFIDKILGFVEDGKAELLSGGEARRVRELLLSVRIIDPAVGSGAFLVGMLQEIIRLITLLDEHTLYNDTTAPNYAYDLKRDIIGKCLYGVDIQEEAVQICELRLWLSLVVDYEPSDAELPFSQWIRDVAPLPNLSYLVRQGNSLIEQVLGERVQFDAPQTAYDIGQTSRIIDAIQELKSVYYRATDPQEKLRIDKEILAKQAELTRQLLTIQRDETNRQYEKKFKTALPGMEKTLTRVEQREKDERRARIDHLQQLVDRADHIRKSADGLRNGDEKVIRQLRNQLGAFIWRVDFGEVFAEHGGFDVVIGNPPYLRIQKIPGDDVDYFNARYLTATGKYDLYVIFTELGISMCNPSGILSFIMPNKFMKVGYGEGLRKILSRHLQGLIDFDVVQVFPSATNYTCLVFAKKAATTDFKYVGASANDTIERVLLNWRGAPVISKSETTLGAEAWSLASKQVTKILRQMETASGQRTLGDYAEEIRQGLISGGDKILFLERLEERGDDVLVKSVITGKDYELERGILHPLLKGREIRRYHVADFQFYALYPYELKDDRTVLIPESDLAQRFPKAWQYLIDVKDELSQRGSVTMHYPAWYSYWNPRTLLTFKKPKLLTQVLAKHSTFAFDDDGAYLFVGGGNAGGYSVALSVEHASERNYKILLGLLNSTALEFYLRNISTVFRDGYYSYGQQFITQLPIPEINSEISDSIESLVTELIQPETKLPEAKSLQRELDALIYQMYGLQPQDIDLIERKLDIESVQQAAEFLNLLDDLESTAE